MRPGYGNTYGREPNAITSNVERVVHGIEGAAKFASNVQTLYDVGRAGTAIAERLAPLLL